MMGEKEGKGTREKEGNEKYKETGEVWNMIERRGGRI